MSGLRNSKSGLAIFGMVVAALLLSACAETQRPAATGKGSVRGINAMVDGPQLLFLAEERSLGSFNFRGTIGFREWDDLEYTFNFDFLPPGTSASVRVASQFIDVVADTQYTIALTGSVDNPSLLVWEEPRREWSGAETVFEADFVHLSPLTGQVDVYYALEGTAPVAGNEIGTLSYGERLPYREFPEGDYELTLTAPGDPSTILYAGTATRQALARRVTVALFDPDRSVTAPVNVNVILPDGATQTPADRNSPARLRMLNTLVAGGDIDGYFDGNFGSAVFPGVGFAELSSYTNVGGTSTMLTVTEAGSPANVLAESELQTINNTWRTAAVYLDGGETKIAQYINDGRTVSEYPQIRVTDFSENVDSLDIYELEAGTVIDATVPPTFAAAAVGLSTGYFPSDASMREITITARGEKTPIATPLALDLVDGQIVDLVIVDTADPAVVELRVLESVLP